MHGLIIILTMSAAIGAMVGIRRGMLGGQMEQSFEMLKSHPRLRSHVEARRVAVPKVAPVQDRILDLNRRGNRIPIEAKPPMPRAS